MKIFKIFSVLFIFSIQVLYCTEYGDKTKSFKVSPGGLLDISLSVGEIRISTWSKNEVQIEAKGIDDINKLNITNSDKEVKVRLSSGWSSWEETTFQINVPEKFNLELKTSSGDLRVSGNLNGDIKAHTSGGDIRINNIHGSININTSGGDVTTGNIIGNSKIHTSGGDISTGTISGVTEIATMGGDIKTLDVNNSLSAKTYGGDIIIGDIGGNANLTTYGGDVRANNIKGNADLTTFGGDIKVQSANGKVNAKTSGGDLRLHNISGSVNANTASGDIVVELLTPGKEMSKISTSNGEITLYISENSKAEIDASIRLHSTGYDGEYPEIKSDFQSQSYSKENRGKRIKAVYILNGGGEKIILETVNSDIKIRKLIK